LAGPRSKQWKLDSYGNGVGAAREIEPADATSASRDRPRTEEDL